MGNRPNYIAWALAFSLLLSLPAPIHAAKAQVPVKVFILAGQSNVEGQAVVDLTGPDYNGGRVGDATPFRDDQGCR